MKRTAIILISIVLLSALPSCNKFLDTLPDNRTELNSKEKIQKLLVSAYSTRTYVRFFEYASDNVELFNRSNNNTNTLIEQNYAWEPITEASNESNVNTWQGYYQMIATANAALGAIEEMGTPDEVLPYKGEALLCRAYAHLCLTMIYCLPYHPEYASEYLGVTYMDKPETSLNPRYTRGTLQEDYEKIGRDIEAALPLIDDEAYSVPKYHFNKKAAYALATRFYIYSNQWQKAVDAATQVLSSNPSDMLRDWSAARKLTYDYSVKALDYVDPGNKFNLLLMTLYSENGSLFNAWSASGSRYSHTNRIAKMETLRAKRPMGGPYDTGKEDSCDDVYQMPPFIWYDLKTNNVYFPKWPGQWETVDAVAGTGYVRSTMVAFSANEVLLNRAEAYIQLKEYDKAAADLDAWSCSVFRVGSSGIKHLSKDLIETVYGDPSSDLYIPEYTRETPTSRKAIHPHGFTVEPGTQEYFTQCLLFCKRVDSLEEGLRWMDLKRYGITIDRFDDSDYDDVTTSGYKATVTLPYNDLRRAFQIPQESIKAGLEPNPRNNAESPSHPFVNY